jgi:hypothetical protein
MKSLVDHGRFRAIGLSDITLNGQLPIYESARIKPAVIQVEAHPYLPETELLEFCKEKNIVFLAFAPLGHGMKPGPLEDRFRTSPKVVEKWFTDLPPARVAMEAETHSIWISEQLQELGHEVIVANVRELRAISHSDRKSDQVDAEKLARYARLDPQISRPIAHRTVEQQEAFIDPSARPSGSIAHSGSERCAWTDQVMRLSDARFLDTVFRQAKPGRYAIGTRAGTRSSAGADRGDDRQD